jgi:hypothetical protein
MRRIAFLMLLAAPAFGACDWFAAPEGAVPFGIVADMDGDGLPDVVTFDIGITIHYGGDFERVLELRKGFQHSAIAIADFDRDGHLDIAAGQPIGGPDELLLYRGSASYEARPIGDIHPSTMQAVDLDGDGVPDLVAISGNDVMTALNDGHGNFRVPQRTGVRTQATLLATVDFDGDQKGDVAVLDGDLLAVYRGDGRGGLQRMPSPEVKGTVAVQAADLDRDGKADLLVGTQGRVLVERSTGSGFTLTAELQPGGTPAQIAVGDVDHDGTPDVFVVVEGRVTIWRNEEGTARSFRRAPDVTEAYSAATGVATADFDADGLTDVLLGPIGPLLFGRGNGTFISYRQRLNLPTVRFAAAGDIDGDGDTDVVADLLTYWGGGSLTSEGPILLRNVSGRLVFEDLPIGFVRMDDLKLADLDGDGRPEIILSAVTISGPVVDVLRAGPGRPERVASFAAAPRTLVAAGDFDGDGRKELAFAAGVETGRIVKAVAADRYEAAGDFPLAPGSSPAAAADFDGDGRDDLVLLRKDTGSGNGLVQALFSAGNGTFAAPLELRKDAQTVNLLLGDFDGDSRPDIAIDDEEVFIAYASGRGFDVRQLDSRSAELRDTVLESVADVDGDGRDELLALTHGTGIKTLFLGDRGAPLRRVNVLAAHARDYSIPLIPIDLSGTGRLDLLTFDAIYFTRCPPLREHRRPR